MRIIYKDDKTVEAVSISSVAEPTCEAVCPYHTEEHDCNTCQHCFTADDDNSVFDEQKLYMVDDSDPNNKKLNKQKRKKIVIDHNSELIEETDKYKKYKFKPKSNQEETLTIKFMYDDEMPIMPVGKLKLKTKRGKLTWRQMDLNGTQSQVQVGWWPPEESIDVRIKVIMEEWGSYEYNINSQLIMELHPD